MIIKPNIDEVPAYYRNYIDLVQSNDLMSELRGSQEKTNQLILSIPAEMVDFAYQDEKWSIKEVFRHIIDCERIFAYRAFRFSRFDGAELAGFDENKYIESLKNLEYNLEDLTDDYNSVRNSTIQLYSKMSDLMLDYSGIANKFNFTARGLGYTIVGHNLHHCNFIKTRYLK
jgi:hypothetical protein